VGESHSHPQFGRLQSRIALPASAHYIRALLKISATAEYYMGSQRTRGPLSYYDIPLSLREHTSAHFSVSKRKNIAKVTIVHYILSPA
jgi:hypothetical protein